MLPLQIFLSVHQDPCWSGSSQGYPWEPQEGLHGHHGHAHGRGGGRGHVLLLQLVLKLLLMWRQKSLGMTRGQPHSLRRREH